MLLTFGGWYNRGGVPWNAKSASFESLYRSEKRVLQIQIVCCWAPPIAVTSDTGLLSVREIRDERQSCDLTGDKAAGKITVAPALLRYSG